MNVPSWTYEDAGQFDAEFVSWGLFAEFLDATFMALVEVVLEYGGADVLIDGGAGRQPVNVNFTRIVAKVGLPNSTYKT